MGGCGLAGLGGYGLIPGSCGVGLARQCGGGVVWLDRVAVDSLAFGLMRRWGGVNGL